MAAGAATPLSLYREWAPLYDRIYHFKDYAAESTELVALLGKLGVAEGSYVVEAACGTGEFLKHLCRHFRMAGFDLHEPMLAQARGKLDDSVALWQADMRSFELTEPADAILCLFSSIGYLSPEELALAAAGFQRGLKPGGVLLLEPFVTPERFEPGRGSLHTYHGADMQLARANVAQRDGDRAILDFHWLVVRQQMPVETFCERHELWLHTDGQIESALRAGGLSPTLDEQGLSMQRGLWIATKPVG